MCSTRGLNNDTQWLLNINFLRIQSSRFIWARRGSTMQLIHCKPGSPVNRSIWWIFQYHLCFKRSTWVTMQPYYSLQTARGLYFGAWSNKQRRNKAVFIPFTSFTVNQNVASSIAFESNLPLSEGYCSLDIWSLLSVGHRSARKMKGRRVERPDEKKTNQLKGCKSTEGHASGNYLLAKISSLWHRYQHFTGPLLRCADTLVGNLRHTHPFRIEDLAVFV